MRSIIVYVISLSLFTIQLSNALLLTDPCCSKIPHASASFGKQFLSDDLGVEAPVGWLGHDGCSVDRSLAEIYKNNIVIIPRGNCTFVEKVAVAQELGALGVIIYNSVQYAYEANRLIVMGASNTTLAATLTIPSVFISFNSYRYLLSERLSRINQILVAINVTGEINPQDMAGEFGFGGLVFLFQFSLALWSMIAIFYLFHYVRGRYARYQRMSAVRKLPTKMFQNRTNGRTYARVDSTDVGDIELQPIEPSSSFCSTEHPDDLVVNAADGPSEMTDYFGGENCVICLANFENGDCVTMLPCGHMYHKDCIEPWLIKKSALCPICKQSILPNGDARSLEEISTESQNDSNDQPGNFTMVVMVVVLVILAMLLALLNVFSPQ